MIASPSSCTADAARGRGAVRTSGSAARVITQRHGDASAARALGVGLAAAGAPVVIAGFGGGLQPGQRPGQIVVATEVRVAGGAPGGLPIPAGLALADQLRRAGHDVVTGPIVSSRSVVRGATRRRLGAEGALAVDMESAWLAGRLLADRPDPHRRRPGAQRRAGPRAASTPACCATGSSPTSVLRRIAPVFDTWAARRGAARGPARPAAVVLRRGRAGHRHRRPGARAARRAGLRAPPDHPQHPRRATTSSRSGAVFVRGARRGAGRAP